MRGWAYCWIRSAPESVLDSVVRLRSDDDPRHHRGRDASNITVEKLLEFRLVTEVSARCWRERNGSEAAGTGAARTNVVPPYGDLYDAGAGTYAAVVDMNDIAPFVHCQ